MNRQHHAKSSLFLMELLFNLLLFCFLCGCGLLFFVKSSVLQNHTIFLQNAARISTSVANIYEQGDGSYSSLCSIYPLASTEGNFLYIYFDETYQPCGKDSAVSYIVAEKIQTTPDTIQIDFYHPKDLFSYSIQACHYTPFSLQDVKEEAVP